MLLFLHVFPFVYFLCIICSVQHQDRSNVLPGYGSISSTPTAVHPTAGSLQLPSPSQDSMGESQQLLQNLYGSALYLPDMLDEQDNDDHMFHEHKYSTVLRSCGFQYDDDEEVRTRLIAGEKYKLV